jgi:hypothetical protein
MATARVRARVTQGVNEGEAAAEHACSCTLCHPFHVPGVGQVDEGEGDGEDEGGDENSDNTTYAQLHGLCCRGVWVRVRTMVATTAATTQVNPGYRQPDPYPYPRWVRVQNPRVLSIGRCARKVGKW